MCNLYEGSVKRIVGAILTTVTWYWFQVVCLSTAGPLVASMRFVYTQRKNQMGSVEEEYHTEFRFISQAPSLSMSDDI